MSDKMKRAIAYIVLVLVIQFQAFSQSGKVWERVYVATDKHTYVAGDKVWCSLYCFTEDDGVALSTFSSIAYLELQTNDQVVLTAKIALEGGRGAGALEIPPTLPTGNYRLVAYTKQSRNEAGFVPSGKILSVFNVLTTERLDENVEIVPSGTILKERPSSAKYGDIDVKVPVEPIRAGKEFFITLSNNFSDVVSLSLSIYNQEPYIERSNYGIVNFWGELTQSEKGEITDRYIPDYEGEVLNLNTAGGSGRLLFSSFFGNQSNFYVSTIDDFGKTRIVTPNVYGDQDLFCEGATSVSIEDPFMRSVSGGIPSLKMSQDMERDLVDLSFSMQVGRRFDADTLYKTLPVRPSLLFSDHNKVVYKLDDYTRFPTMEEVLFEFVTEVKVRNVKKQKTIAVMVETPGAVISNPQFTSGIPLVMLDGILITDHKKIIEFDPLLVEKIEIWKEAFSIGPRYYEGAVNFVTYKRDLAGLELGSDVKILPYKGSLYPLAFTGQGIKEGGDYPDYRQTIYWHPLLDLAGGERREIRCIAPLYDGDFDVVVEGVTSEGKVIYYRTSLNTLSSGVTRTIQDSEIMDMVQSISASKVESKPMNKTLPATVSSVTPSKSAVVVPSVVPDAVSAVVKEEVKVDNKKVEERKPAETKQKRVSEALPHKDKSLPKSKVENKKTQSLPIRKEREGQLKEGVKYKSSIEIR